MLKYEHSNYFDYQKFKVWYKINIYTSREILESRKVAIYKHQGALDRQGLIKHQKPMSENQSITPEYSCFRKYGQIEYKYSSNF